ncbi:glycosyltransferase [Thiothrix lacustris]|uniref:Glycosyltransferase n=1 Tax=Thiothrix lacustris TaxID=525917 RepID=A0ABY9MTQ3_9GAMM|nr:glycosyltransferase [Thiothrix lacustris]WML91937.1 glycosyltransferase [Thiothrix lacustris]
MNARKPSICLSMIVKNESEIITRCLDSIKDLIDYWVISDTGSTDGTQQIITDYFKQHNIPGLLIENEWKNFAHNRNLALEQALGRDGYILIMDADDYLSKSEEFRFHKLTADSYGLKMQRNGIEYYNERLIRASLPWKWHGVLHEYLSTPTTYSRTNLSGDYVIQSTTEGARSQNPNKYKNDIKVLEEALREEPDNTRYQFYLAQSYRDDHNFEQASLQYQKRADMGGWPEEVYYSLLEVAKNRYLLGHDHLEVINAFLIAHTYRPQRLEALHEAIKICRINGHYHLGLQLGWPAKDTSLPNDILFVEKSIYEWRFTDELSICAAYTNKHKEAAKMMKRLLNSPKTPAEEKSRLEANLRFAQSLT